MSLKNISLDGYGNTLSRIERRSKAIFFEGDSTLDPYTLGEIFRSGGLGKRIVELPTTELTRAWFEINGDIEGKLAEELKRLDAKKKITELVRWSKLYGGAIMLIGCDDGLEFSEPLFEKGLRKITSLHVFDCTEATIAGSEIYEDLMDPRYGQPMYYQVTTGAGDSFIVHESRVIVMHGASTTHIARQINDGWSDSVLQGPWNDLKQLGDAMHTVKKILDVSIQAVFKMRDLINIVSSQSKVEQDQLVKRFELLEMTSGVANTIVIDGGDGDPGTGEEYEKQTSTITGIGDLVDRFVRAVAASTGIPVTILMGQSPAGLAATGDNDVRSWYDKVQSEQNDILTPVIERLLYLLMISRDGVTGGKILDNIDINYRPLWQQTDKETAEAHKIQADADAVYMEWQVIAPGEIRRERFSGAKFSFETALSMEEYDDPADIGNTPTGE